MAPRGRKTKAMRKSLESKKLALAFVEPISSHVPIPSCVQVFVMPAIEAAHYAIGLTVHDEIITECDADDSFNVAGLSALLAANKPWNAGLPLAASGFEATRYRKD